jgi:sec-independent protein translocase protein TatC
MSDRRHTDDLFDNSTMTFGSHLDELRVTLFRALIGLMIGFLVGLGVAKYVVMYIESPLRNALETYYINKDIGELEAASDNKKIDDATKAFITDNKLISEEFLIEHDEVKRFEKAVGEPPKKLDELLDEQLPFPGTSFIKVRIFRPVETRITALNAQEAFMIWLKAAFVTGLVLSSPYMFYHLWNFIAAGLYPHERRYVHIYLPFSILLFMAGASMAFLFVFKPVLDFLFTFNQMMNIDPDPRISEWVGFVLFLPIGFGVAFQLPLVMLFVNRIGVLTVETMVEKWRIAILAIFVLAMVLTPADPVSMMMLAVPLTLLYFLGILLCKWMPRGRNPFNEETYEP